MDLRDPAKEDGDCGSNAGPRLLLVSGSSTLFGMDAKIITEETGYRTVNFGTHAGLGLDYILTMTRKIARPGDIICCRRSTSFIRPSSRAVFMTTISWGATRIFSKLPLTEKVGMAMRIPISRIQKGWRILRTPENVRPHDPFVDALNEYGDEIANTVAKRPATSRICNSRPRC